MSLFTCLWKDEAGVLLSSEAVVVGTVAVVGLTAGLSAISTAVNEELKDVAFAIRSLDQSYTVPERKGCGAWTAGSTYRQEPIKTSFRKLNAVVKKAEKQEKAQADRLRQQLERQNREAARKSSKQKNSTRKKQKSKKSDPKDGAKTRSKKRSSTT
jgi:hypothetical protein